MLGKHYHNNSTNERIKGLTVEVRNNDVGKALRIFKKKVMEAGILQEVREREAYVKPSLVRKKAKAAGISRWKKKKSKMELGTPSSHNKSK
tara:strand:+ start:1575 stop:1847 length:273 start_codon:yes stop_codon:yes gene_type:complete